MRLGLRARRITGISKPHLHTFGESSAVIPSSPRAILHNSASLKVRREFMFHNEPANLRLTLGKSLARFIIKLFIEKP